MVAPTSTEELIERNAKYAPMHESQPLIGKVETPRDTQALVIITCLGHRVHPEQFMGFSPGEVRIVRNAGGRARSAVLDVAFLDHLITIAEIVVIHHTNCGCTLITDKNLRSGFLARSAEEFAKFDTTGLCWTDVYQSVRDDVKFLRDHPFVRKSTRVAGLVYDIETGKLDPVVL